MIWWYDAESSSGWEVVKDVKAHAQLTLSVGFVIKESKHAVVLANTWNPETESCNGRITIPVGMIRKRLVKWRQKKTKTA